MDDIKEITKHLSGRLASGKREPDFFELVRLLELSMPDYHPEQDPSSRNKLCFGQVPHLNFPETAMAGIEGNSAGQILLRVYFFGLLGGNGPMSLTISSYVRQRSVNNYDHTTERFLDIINDHFLKLYYRAWAKQRAIVCADDPENDSIKAILSGLSGAPAILNEGGWRRQTGAMIASAFAYSSFRRGHDGLQMALSRFFNILVQLETRILCPCNIPKECRFHLGEKHTSVLGTNMQIGRKVLCLSRMIRFIIGPISFEQYQKMVPGTSAFQHFRSLVALYLNRPMKYEIVFKLKSSTIPEIRMNSGTNPGRSFWLGKVPVDPNICIHGETHQLQDPDGGKTIHAN